MSNLVLQGNNSGNGTFTFVAPNSDTNRTLSIPDEAGSILTSASDIPVAKITGTIVGNGPVFAAYRNSSNFTFSSATWTKVALNAVDYDSASAFDTSTNYRYTATTAGYYLISAAAYHDYSAHAAGSIQTAIYKNGSAVGFSRDVQDSSAYNYGIHPITKLVYLNGTTDYIEMYVYSSNTSPYLNYGLASTWMTGFLARAA